MSSPSAAAIETVFAEHERFLWGLAYRLTGSAADADDVVQETFVRAIERGPERTDLPWRPWLVRVAVNVGRDVLRRRRRQRYVGQWLPGPATTERVIGAGAGDAEALEGASPRYDIVESASYAFLIALERLTPQQRAVLVLRDAFDYSVRETAAALGISLPNVKTTLHRARRAMADYEGARPSAARTALTERALARFMAALAQQDIDALERLLAEPVRAISDGGGDYHAALLPIVGREKVARFFLAISAGRGVTAPPVVAVASLNGLPAAVIDLPGDDRPAGYAPRVVIRVEVDGEGRIVELHSILAPRKLAGVPSH